MHFTRPSLKLGGVEVHAILLIAICRSRPTASCCASAAWLSAWRALQRSRPRQIAKDYVVGNRNSFHWNVVIWKNKVRIDKPAVAENDGPV